MELSIHHTAIIASDYQAAREFYVEKLGLRMDAKCFFGTIKSVLRSDGVVEGGTGEMKKAAEKEVVGK